MTSRVKNRDAEPRRSFLRGLGTVIALPALESLLPAAETDGPPETARKAPQRMVFVFMPNGAHMADWTPVAEGSDYALPWILEPLESFRQDLLVLSGLTHATGTAGPDGGGDHARALATFLTGVRAKKTFGKDIRAGYSVDQIAAQHIGHHTRLTSLELGCEIGRSSGNCDTGYSCAYSNNLSWRTPNTPAPADINPRSVFDRLFFNVGTSGDEARAQRDLFAKSVIDFALEDARQLKAKLGNTDRRKVDEYLSSIRDIERRVKRIETATATESADRRLQRPTGIPHDFGEHVRLMADLLVIAFQGDVTRISTLMLGRAGSNRSYPFIGVPDGHHWLSHHGGDKEKQIKIRKINRFLVEQFAYFLGKLKSIKEGERTMLDNCMIVYGSGIADGNAHNHDNLPVLLAGNGGGSVESGRHIRYADNEPLMNLYLAMLQRLGIDIESVGDSQRPLPGLTA
ncbi:MAG: hypothetical protein CMJ59_10665 [Planctomycetaceae bacterium]|nr:hypothetical protein [Planctomycetaceae bacterium]